jgi:pimeloyl-ACP methyl ester carboxylesterase
MMPAELGRLAESHSRFGGALLQTFCGGTLFAERYGSASAEVVGLHGWARTRADLAGPLAGLNALAFDLPGFGASPDPPAAWGAKDYAALLAAALVDLDRPQVVLGHSFGGRVAISLAASRPELVSGLVLTGVPMLRKKSAGASSPWRFRAARWGSRHGFVSASRMEKLRHRYGSDDYRNARGIMRSVLVRVVNESYEEDLARIKCPVELIWGANDTAAPVAVAREASELLQHAKLEVIPGGGHMTPLSSPDVLRQSVQRLLRVSAP